MEWLIDRFSFRKVVKPFTPMLGVPLLLSGVESRETYRSDSGSYGFKEVKTKDGIL